MMCEVSVKIHYFSFRCNKWLTRIRTIIIALGKVILDTDTTESVTDTARSS